MDEQVKQQEPDSVILPIALENDILNYMNEKPHKEVFNLIAAVQKNAQLISTKPLEADTAKKPDAIQEEVKTEVIEEVKAEEVKA